jgi:hypothetical protein
MHLYIPVVFVTAAVVFILVLITEGILIYARPRWYFTNGIRIFQRTVTLHQGVHLPLHADDLQTIIPASRYSTFLVREIDSGKFTVTEKAFEPDGRKTVYTQLMRCLVTIYPLRREATIIGLLNLTPVVFSVCFLTVPVIIIVAGDGSLVLLALFFTAGPILILSLIYWNQRTRYNGICDSLAGIQSGTT